MLKPKPVVRVAAFALMIALMLTLFVAAFVADDWRIGHADDPAPTTTTAATLPAPVTTAVELPITAPATATAAAVRVSPPTTAPQYDDTAAPPCNMEGLFCLPFYDGDPADLCAEMMFYLNQQQAPIWLGDQPRTGPATQKGIGWRESNCKNTVTSSTGCCRGYFQINPGNITAYGYAASGLWAWCGIERLSDYFGSSPLQKQKSVCAAIGLANYHTQLGQNARWEVWDKWL